jgi:hypothetical protein
MVALRVSRAWLRGLAASGVLFVSSCSSTSSSSPPTISLPPAEVPAPTAGSVPPTAAPEPTGVPGLSATDPFCAAWASYAGTVQALGVAASFGDLTSDRLAALELAAAPRLVDVAAEIEASWPSDLDVERSVVIDQRIGPHARRAQRAVDALTAAGVTAADLATLRSVWQESLSHRDPEVAVIALPALDAELQTKLEVAAHAYDTAVTPFAADPSLSVEGVSAPATDAYLSAHCPDLASIGVGDAL